VQSSSSNSSKNSSKSSQKCTAGTPFSTTHNRCKCRVLVSMLGYVHR
jgi:hypothetical protein